MSKSFVEKYRPESWEDLAGSQSMLTSIRQWAEGWESGDEPLLFAGRPGTGKTSTAQVIANEMDWPIREVNASDARRTDDIEEIAALVANRPVMSEYQLVLLDEADSIPGRTSLTPLLDELDEPPNPVVVVCNEYWEVSKALRNRCEQFDFELDSSQIRERVIEVAKAEGIDIGAATAGELAGRDNLRDALMDLQQVREADESIVRDERSYEQNPFDVAERVVRGQYDELPEEQLPKTPEEFLWWIEENILDDFRGVEAAVAWDLLSRSDVWLERARSGTRENYRFWRYASELQKAVAAVRLTDPYSGYIQIDNPTRQYRRPPSASGSTNEAELFRQLTSEAGGVGLGCNFEEFRRVYLPMLQELPLEDRFKIVLEDGLSDGAMKALDVEPDEYEEWSEVETADVEQQSVLDWGS